MHANKKSSKKMCIKGRRMRRMEFAIQIEKHKAIVRRYKTVSGVVRSAKLLPFFLMGASLYLSLTRGFPAELIIAGPVALVALWMYHDKVHKKISSSKDIIAINKRHLARMPGEWSTVSDIESGLAHHAYPLKQQELVEIPGMETDFLNYIGKKLSETDEDSPSKVLATGLKSRPEFNNSKAFRFLLM
jgi:hypothetical protein